MKSAARIAAVAFGLVFIGSAWAAADDAKRFATEAAAGSIADLDHAQQDCRRKSNRAN